MVRTWHTIVVLSLLAAFLAATGAVADESPRTDDTVAVSGRIQVQAMNLRNSTGVVRCNLFTGPAGFPDDASKAIRTATVSIKDGQATCHFTDVAPGWYAIGMLHDENRNSKMDTNLFGVPREGYGASNDARSSLGAPNFKDARFSHPGGTVILRLKTTY